MGSKEYWDRKIIDWEKSSYDGMTRQLGIIEKIATKFRGPIKNRKQVLLNLLGGLVKDKTVLELGCGSGALCFSLLLLGAKKVIGVDISPAAIEAAKKMAFDLGVQDRSTFLVGDIRDDIILPLSDFVVGLGFIDYIDRESLKKLFSKIKGRFIFSFPEKKINLINILHYLYLKSQGCPTFYKFRRSEFTAEGCRFFEKDKLVFIANFMVNEKI